MSILGISRYFSTKNKREKWEWRGHQDEEKKMETKETNWWGNDTNEGSRLEVGWEMIENAGEEVTCITNRMAKVEEISLLVVSKHTLVNH